MATIRRVAVLGAGTMGAAIAGHCANAGLSVDLLDLAPDRLTPEEEVAGLTLESPAVRNRIARAGFERLLASRPPALFTPSVADLITLGNFSDDLGRLGQADWIVEAVVERLDAKQRMLAQTEAVRRPGSVVSSNTSGIPLHLIAEGRSPDFRRHFLGTHFFNPPRSMKLLELIPTGDTEPEVLERMRTFAERVLGKRTVVCKDTPGFIANRVGTFSGMTTIRHALAHGLGIEEVDALTGPLIGRPRTATFRLADLAGLDVMVGVATNLYAALPDDESRDELQPPEPLKRLVAAGRLGNKTGAGFYKRVERPGARPAFHVVDLQTLEYRPPSTPDLPLAAEVGGIRDLGERLRAIMARAVAGDRQAALVEAALLPTLAYAARRIPEISDDIVAVDDAVRWGFGHALGPFQTWDALGVEPTARRMRYLGIAVAPWVDEMLAAGHATFYRREARDLQAYCPPRRRYEVVRRDPDYLDLRELEEAGKKVAGNADASLVDLGDGVLCLELHAKANAIGREAVALLGQAVDLLEGDTWRAMVIGNQGDYFSAGVNLAEVVAAAQSGSLAQVDAFLATSQDLLQRLRFAPKPVVAAPFGATMGLGLEVCFACAAICADADVAMGLTETGLGLIPAGGGCKELVRRIVSPPLRTSGADPLPYLRRVLETVGQAKVSTSAADARELGFLAESDRIVLGRDRLLAEAKRMALGMAEAGYRPPASSRTCYAAGRDALAALLIEIHQVRAGGYISDYDAYVAGRLAAVLCGGDLSRPQWVDERYLLAMERQAIGALLGEPKTQERIAHFLRTGERLRN